MLDAIGLILRVFSPRPDLIESNVASVKSAVDRALTGAPFRRVDILISADSRFGDSDCGGTAFALRRTFGQARPGYRSVFVSEVTKGDIYCGLLNYGIATQVRHGVDYSVILSSGVQSYATPETFGAMGEAAGNGARVIGVVVDELSESIRAGRIANTFAMWHNVSLMAVGGFDLRAAKPRKDDRLARYLRGWSREQKEKDGNGEVFYNFAGVEEIIPLVRLIDTYGPCIAPIVPQGAVKQWVTPDPVSNPEGYARHLKKLGTKFERQAAFAAMERVDLSFLKGGVMPEYRT